ncbi:MAG: N-acetylmuramoyl-L-alanine amidase [Alphaproteobacteria bacterium CG_4_10_14_0_2_um_filter_63_37]|nr:MAG: hypothetical protein AUJ55_13065 [Proteobacteria bacterium CG1_02_64_396]PJA25170.1 MAG: N-acetylmuramoyl-L-alanine amidase [Alphaproteobacteria bacterium CG_4_10_14_0_2_um_filter_63_37]
MFTKNPHIARLLGGFLALVLLSGAAQGAAMGKLTGLRLDTGTSTITLVAQGSDLPTIKPFVLKSPDRIVIDLPATELNCDLPEVSGFVRSIRAGHPNRQTLRLVLDLEAPCTVKSFPQGDAWKVQIIPPKGQRHNPTWGKPVVVVDAGHGGKDPGAIGPGGTMEKEVTLAIALKLARRLEALGARVVLTRDHDTFIKLKSRVQIAQEAHADLFISIHADALEDHRVTGASVYCLSERGASDKAAAVLAERENAADEIGGVVFSQEAAPVAAILLDLMQRDTINNSLGFAKRVIAGLDAVTGNHADAPKQAGFAVLKAPAIPSVLVEVDYISNRAMERKLASREYQTKLADAIARATLTQIAAMRPAWQGDGEQVATAGGDPMTKLIAGQR